MAFALTANCFFHTSQVLGGFRWNLLDTLVLTFFAGTTLGLLSTDPASVVFENSAGAFVDTFLPYLLFRLCIKNKADLIQIVKTLVLISLPLGVAGVIESSTGRNFIGLYGPQWRDGHFRAYGTFHVHIAFGVFFAIVIPLSLSLWHLRVWPKWFLLLSCFFCMGGLLSTWSSGPIFALYFTGLVFITYPVRRAIPVIILMAFASLVLIDQLSNRHWYDVLTRFGLSASTSQYRIDLYREAFGGGMTGHWIFGWGLVANAYSTYEQFPWEHRDMTSLFISILAKHGLVGLIPLLAVLVVSTTYMTSSLKKTSGVGDRWFLWSFIALWVGLNGALLTVSILSQVLTLYFLLLACFSIIGSNFFLVRPVNLPSTHSLSNPRPKRPIESRA